MAWLQKGKGGSRFNRTLCRVLFGVAVMAVAPAAWCDELSLLVNGWAHHLDVPKDKSYNERNWGAGFQYEFDRVNDAWVPFVMASGFKDSEYHMSYYAGGGAMRRFDVAPSLDNLHVDLGAVAFLMTRKNFNNNQPFFGALPAASVGTAHFAFNITYIPRVHPKLIPLWFVQLKIPLMKF